MIPAGPCSSSEPSTACSRAGDSPVQPSRVTKPAAASVSSTPAANSAKNGLARSFSTSAMLVEVRRRRFAAARL
jgi:hypothetical protein